MRRVRDKSAATRACVARLRTGVAGQLTADGANRRSSFGLQVGVGSSKSGVACVHRTRGEVLHFRFESAVGMRGGDALRSSMGIYRKTSGHHEERGFVEPQFKSASGRQLIHTHYHQAFCKCYSAHTERYKTYCRG